MQISRYDMNTTQIIACVGIALHGKNTNKSIVDSIAIYSKIHFRVALCKCCLKACSCLHIFDYINCLGRCVTDALLSKKHVELIFMTPFQAYLTDDSSNTVFTTKITFRLCRSIVIIYGRFIHRTTAYVQLKGDSVREFQSQTTLQTQFVFTWEIHDLFA